MKRTYFVLFLFLGIALILLLGTISTTSLTSYPVGWSINATTSDASSCETLKAAPGAGSSLYIRQIHVNCANDVTVTVGRGESSDNVIATIIGPVTFKAAGTNYMDWTFLLPIRVPDNNSITLDASGSGAVQVFIAGYTK